MALKEILAAAFISFFFGAIGILFIAWIASWR
jgi:uncharacterized membrane protein YdcZ (DUF606 family)